MIIMMVMPVVFVKKLGTLRVVMFWIIFVFVPFIMESCTFRIIMVVGIILFVIILLGDFAIFYVMVVVRMVIGITL